MSAGNSKQYKDMTRKELYEAAKAGGHRGVSKYKKAQLLELLLRSASETVPEKLEKLEPGDKPPSVETAAVEAVSSPVESTESREPQDVQVHAEVPVGPAEVEPHEVYVDWGYPLPEHYGLDRIGAAAKDPNWIFAYWDLSGSRKKEVAQTHGPEIFSTSRWHLRVIDVNSGEHADYPINVDSRNWYLPVSEDGTFKILIGLLTGDGRFIEFASTREIRTPRQGPSGSVSEKWMVADELFQRFLRQVGAPGASGLSSSELSARIRTDLSKQ